MDKEILFQSIASVSKAQSLPVYVVGGFVRDALLGDDLPKQDIVEENRVQAAIEKDIVEGGGDVIIEEYKKKIDIDFVVLGSGIAFARAFAAQYSDEEARLVEFEDFDTARVLFFDTQSGERTSSQTEGERKQYDITMEVEFAGARKEAYRSHSRKPIVEPATLEEDLSRRDFTVNAMAREVTAEGLGDVVDPFDGVSDLHSKLLRTPLDPDETFSEDPLRMLRAARFAAQLGFEVEEATLASITKNATRLEIISPERIQEEFMKLLGTPVPSVGLWILFHTKLFEQFLREVPALFGVTEIYGQHHKENLRHTFQVVDNIATRTYKPLLRYAALMHDIGKPGTKEFHKGRGWTFDMHEHLGRKIVRTVGKRLRMSKADTEYVANLVRWHQQPIQLMDSSVTDSPVRRLVVNLGDDIDDLLKLCRSDITTGNPHKLERRLKNYDILEAKIIHVIEKDKLRAFQSPVRGEEIMEQTGLKGGPTLGKIKKAIENAILDGKIPNEYEAAKRYLKEIQQTYVDQAEDWER